MVTEKELRDKCTPEIIKKMCELTEGFEYNSGKQFIFNLGGEWISFHYHHTLAFSTLIHRAVEGWNQKCKFGNGIILYPQLLEYFLGQHDECFTLMFSNYISENLTRAECAMLNCLLEVLE